MNTKDVNAKDISLSDIDKLLILYCTLPDNNSELIAERLFLDIDQTNKIIQCFEEQKKHLGFTGYNLQNNPEINLENESTSESGNEIESPSETISLHKILPERQDKLDQLNSSDISTLLTGVNAWENAYYPKKRYRPLVFSNPDDVIYFINGMKIIGIETTSMIATTPETNGKWYSSDTDTNTLTINIENKSTQFKFNQLSEASNIPLPLSRERITTKERISLSIDKNAESYIAYQKRLHRLLFLLSIYLKSKTLRNTSS